MAELYRVEKDGMTHYVQPHQLQYYADNGYRIYREVEVRVTDVAGEIARIEDGSQTAQVTGSEAS